MLSEGLIPAAAGIRCGSSMQRGGCSPRARNNGWNALRPTDCARIFYVNCHEVHITHERVEHHHRRGYTLYRMSRVRTDLKECNELEGCISPGPCVSFEESQHTHAAFARSGSSLPAFRLASIALWASSRSRRALFLPSAPSPVSELCRNVARANIAKM